MIKISCIIPAFNEEKNIWNILKILKSFLWKEIFEIIVVNDHSSDNTSKVLKNFKNIKIIENTKNLWKSRSVAKAIEKTSWNFIFLLDADLKNLNKKNILDFIKPIFEKKTKITIAFLKNSWPLFPFKKIDYCSWQRIIPKNILLKDLEKIKNLQGYGLEVFLNKIIIEKKIAIKVIKWENVENDFHHKKSSFLKWWEKNLKIWRNILKSWWWILWIYKMNFDLEKLIK